MNKIKQVTKLQTLVNNFLANNLANDTNQVTLDQSMKYSLMAGGKRLRPTLTLATYSTLGGPITDEILKASCAVELLHTYSLIHDDLPAMDNDDLRRGKATNHMIYGPGIATLAGDGLLTLAFQWLADNNLDDHRVRQLVLALSKAAGPAGMVAGQTSDIEGEHQRLTIDQLRLLHSQKTGALIRYATQAGAILAGASKQVTDLVIQFGSRYGLAFQIYDDLLDVLGTSEQIGKRVHKDHSEHKNMYPELLGVDGAKQELQRVLVGATNTKGQLEQLTGCSFAIYDEFLEYFKG